MAQVIFIDYLGVEREVDATNGDSLMEAATNNDIPGIDADCGGACACATCHVYIDPAWVDVVGGPAELEAEMLEVAEDVRPNSRLSCQVKVSDAMDGLRVTTPESQF